MELALKQRQTQSLNIVMTQELRQAVQLLQYSTYDLYEYLQDEQLENPLIELVENIPRYSDNETGPHVNNQAETDLWQRIPAQYDNLKDHFIEQLDFQHITETEKQIIDYMIMNLDENGYLPEDIKRLACDLFEDQALVNHAFEQFQGLKPIGVGARNLRECLTLQAVYYYPDEPLLVCLIEEHLESLADKRWTAISRQLGISLAEIKRLYPCIQSFNPKPCAHMVIEQPPYVMPDVVVEYKDGHHSFYLNDRFLPRVKLTKQFTAQLHEDHETAAYLHDHYKRYQWLVNSLEQRRQTITCIVQVLLRRQHLFLLQGLSKMQPLTLKDVAIDIGMHESTVSRAVMNKTIQTPQGTFAMRNLFASKLTANHVESKDMSQTTVKWMLKEHIKNEKKQKPYSDQQIANTFAAEQGITISRRTVAKYREELNIPSSSKRKEIDI